MLASPPGESKEGGVRGGSRYGARRISSKLERLKVFARARNSAQKANFFMLLRACPCGFRARAVPRGVVLELGSPQEDLRASQEHLKSTQEHPKRNPGGPKRTPRVIGFKKGGAFR